MSEKLHLGYTDKLKAIRHFSLSRESCQHQTDYCRRVCYGRKGNMARPHVKAAYARNYRLSQDDKFVDWMIYELSNINERYIRIHAVGDFYNLEYFDKWCEIAKARPNITFLAYTRNHEIFAYPRPTNLKLMFSIDESTDITKVPTGARKAFIIPQKFKKEPHLKQVGDILICSKGECSSCGECWTGYLNVGFPLR